MKENAKTGEISDIIRNSSCSISNTENLRKYYIEINKPGPILEFACDYFHTRLYIRNSVLYIKVSHAIQDLRDSVCDCML